MGKATRIIAQESQLHRFTVAALKRAHKGVLWFHVPNGLGRSPITAAKLKNMGARNGAADFVIVAKSRIIFLEIKRTGGKLSPDQVAFHIDVESAGAIYTVADSEDGVLQCLKIAGAL